MGYLHRRLEILALFGDGKQRTAWECVQALPGYEHREVQQRLFDLEKGGMLRHQQNASSAYQGKKYTGVYRITGHGRRWLAVLENGNNV